MFCSKCGAQNEENAFRCVSCGENLHQPAPQVPRERARSERATWSLVFGILGVTCLWIFAGVPAILFGLSAKKQIRKSGGSLAGDGLATAGIVLGICSIFLAVIPLMLMAIAVPNFLEAQVRSKVSRVKTDLRSLATGLECYYVDNSSYPAWSAGEEGANRQALVDTGAFHIPTFRVWTQPWQVRSFCQLTTPVAYMTSYLIDPFADAPGATYSYYSVGNGWILFSPGPDKKYDIDPTEDYDPSISQPSPLLAGKQYDPTNGTVSRGDIFRVKM